MLRVAVVARQGEVYEEDAVASGRGDYLLPVADVAPHARTQKKSWIPSAAATSEFATSVEAMSSRNTRMHAGRSPSEPIASLSALSASPL